MAEEATQETENTETEKTQETSFDWGEVRKTIKDEKARAYAERFLDLESFAKGGLELRQKVSNSIIKPGKDASEEDIANYRKALGVPESPDKYEFDGVKAEEADELTKEALSHWQKVFYDNNIPAETAKALTNAQKELMEKVIEQARAQDEQFAKEAEAALKKEWGSDFDNNKTYAYRAAQELLGEEFESFRYMEDKSGRYIADNPVVLKMLARIGREMGEGRLGPVASGDEVTSIQEQARDITARMHEAIERGDMSEAKRLDKQAKALWEKLPPRQSKDFIRI